MNTGAPIKVLAVDDQEEALFALETVLTQAGYQVVTARSGPETLKKVEQDNPDLILLDVNMPGLTGYEVSKRLKADPDFRYIPIVLLTANSSTEEIVHGLSQGADDYLIKPYRKDELLARVQAILRTRALYLELQRTNRERDSLRGQLQKQASFENIIGSSSSMQAVFSLIEKVADSHVPVLVQGESGTGKELVARAIHFRSNRKEKPFVAQNCSAFQDQLLESELFGHVRGAFTGAVRDKQGLFEAADGGTFFLDELGEMSAPLQAKLLRVLQDGTFIPVGATSPKKVDVRIVAATHRDLHEMMAKGTFRDDLFYRLNVISIKLPPLRERKEDIPALAQYFLQQRLIKNGTAPRSFSSEVIASLSEYHWPGNIRELQNEIERLLLLSGAAEVIGPEALSPHLKKTGSSSAAGGAKSGKLKDAIEDLERSLIGTVLKEVSGNKSEAARILGISRSNLIAKARAYGLGEG